MAYGGSGVQREPESSGTSGLSASSQARLECNWMRDPGPEFFVREWEVCVLA